MRKVLMLGAAIVSVGKITLASEYLACGEKTGDTIQNCWTCGDTCTARLDSKGTFTVSGSGPTYSYDSSNVTPWWKDEVIQAVKNIVVEDGITSIGHAMFSNFNSGFGGRYWDNVQSINLPSSVKSVGFSIFNARTATPTLVISNDVTLSHPAAFSSLNPSKVFCLGTSTNHCASWFPNAQIGIAEKNKDGTMSYYYDNINTGQREYYSATGNLLRSKNADGSTSIYNKDGELTSIRGKKIYTVEEAEAITAHGDKFHVSLTYK